MKFILSLLLIGLFPAMMVGLSACATREVNSSGLELMSERQYEGVLERFTQRSQKYQGLYNTMDVTATLVSTPAAKAQLEQKARLLQWDRAQFQAESNKITDKLKNETEVFLSFYTPERKNDDLQKKTTQWRVYLESGGRRWEGKVTRLRIPVSEIQGLYSYHNRFATPYSVTFPVATSTVDQSPTKFTVTGPVGIVTLEYPAAAGLAQ